MIQCRGGREFIQIHHYAKIAKSAHLAPNRLNTDILIQIQICASVFRIFLSISFLLYIGRLIFDFVYDFTCTFPDIAYHTVARDAVLHAPRRISYSAPGHLFFYSWVPCTICHKPAPCQRISFYFFLLAFFQIWPILNQ